MQDQSENFSFKNFFIPLTTVKAIHILVIVGILVYFVSFFNGFVWDDFPQLLHNPVNQSLANSIHFFTDHSYTYYRPFSSVFLAAIYTFFGPVAFWYHCIQVLLHIGVAILVYLLFKKFFSNILSLLLSLIFLLHPMNVESVVDISAIQSVLSLFLGLVALLLVMNNKLSVGYKYSLIGVLVILSAFSKETGILFIFVIPCFIWLQHRSKFIGKDYFSVAITLLSTLLVYLCFFFFSTHGTNAFVPGSPVPVMQASLFVRLLTLPKLLYYYLFTFVYPKDLAISQQWLLRTINLQDFIFPLVVDCLFVLGLITSFVILIKKHQKQTGIFLFFTIWFFLNWAVCWQFIPLDMTVAERWFYVPMIGLLGMVGVFLQKVVIPAKVIDSEAIAQTCLPTGKTRRAGIQFIQTKRILTIFVILVLCIYSIRSIVRMQNWVDSLTLYTHDEKISSQSYELENELAYEYLLQQQYDLAKPHLDRSISLAPYFWENWANLGVYYEGKKNINKSIESFSTAIRNDKLYYSAYLNEANVFYHYKSLQETKEFLTRTALVTFPQDGYFCYLAGVVDYNLGNKQSAVDEIQKAYTLTHNPDLLTIQSQMEQGEQVK